MFFSKILLKPGPELFRLFKDRYRNNEYGIHQLLWTLFPDADGEKRDFLYRKTEHDRLPEFYLVSSKRPVSNNALMVQSKEYVPQLKKGDRLAFSLTANPIVARKAEGKKNSVKHDVWMDAKKRGKDNGLSGYELTARCENAVKKWLADKGDAYGFTVNTESVLVDGYMKHRFYKKKIQDFVTYSSVHYEGILSVNDPQRFLTRALYQGIGSAKAFGCGLMLVKRVSGR